MSDPASTIKSGIVVSGTAHWFNDYCGTGGEVSWSGMLGRPTIEPQMVALPGRRRLEWVPFTPRTRPLTIAMVLAFTTEAACQSALADLSNLVYSEAGPVTIRRVVPRTGGDVTSDIEAVYVDGFDPERVIGRTQRVVATFQTLTPFWLNGSTEQPQ